MWWVSVDCIAGIAALAVYRLNTFGEALKVNHEEMSVEEVEKEQGHFEEGQETAQGRGGRQ